jgi:hypothetical protein
MWTAHHNHQEVITMNEIPNILRDDKLVEMAVRLGFIGLVSHRGTIQKAYDYVVEMSKADNSSLVPVHIVMNTMALQWAQERLDTLEMMDAIISYCEDDSRSERRKAEMIHGAKLVHEKLTGEEYGAETGTREPEDP